MPAAASPKAASQGEEIAALRNALDLPAESIADLCAYRDLLTEWSSRFNLIGPSVLGDFWSRHVLDSGQLVALAPDATVWTDIGSGAGFPGLVIAILLKRRQGAQVHLVESVGKRCRFLEHVGGQLKLPTVVHQARAESVQFNAQVVTARACAPLPRLLAFAEGHLHGGALGLFLKGRDAESELTQARAQWRLDAELLPSLSDPAGRIVKVKRSERA